MANAGFRITGTTKLFHTHTGQFNCPAPLKMLNHLFPGWFFLVLNLKPSSFIVRNVAIF